VTSSKKAFVTGGGGFLGRHLTATLSSHGYTVTAPRSAECDLTKSDALDRFAHEKFDRIFHLAAWTQAGDFCLRHPGDQWIINQQINTTVLAWWKHVQPQAKLVAIGTSCAYPEEGRLTEDRYMEGEPTPSLYTYAMTKRMLYQGMRALGAQYGLDWLCVVPSTLYGPGYETEGKQLHFIYDLIRKISDAAKGGSAPILWGDGLQRRELIHVDDFIRDLLTLDREEKTGLFNVGAGEDHSIKEFAALICEILGYPSELIQYDISAFVGARTKNLDISKLHATIGKQPRTRLQMGLTSVMTR
jgi:GDP-L-fucose synthase